MARSTEVRAELNDVVENYGISAKYIAQSLGWNYIQFIKFKNNQANYSQARLNELHEFLQRYKRAMSLV